MISEQIPDAFGKSKVKSQKSKVSGAKKPATKKAPTKKK
jgi:hypothetical protein